MPALVLPSRVTFSRALNNNLPALRRMRTPCLLQLSAAVWPLCYRAAGDPAGRIFDWRASQAMRGIIEKQEEAILMILQPNR